MNPLTLLPLLAAVAVAAPGVTFLAAQPGLINVPLTRTIHYQNTPVVTGYQQTILKPALAHAPLAYSGIAVARQIPDLPTNPAPPADVPAIVPNNTNPAPPADLPQIPGAPGQDNNGTGSDQGGAIPPIPGVPGVFLNNANLLQVVNPIQLSAVPQTLQVAQVAQVRAAQAGDFEPLVTKERVLAPVRTHTQITPQLTQIQPEITYRRVIQDVPVIQQFAAVQQFL